MGNKDSIITQSKLEIVEKEQRMHLGQVTLMKNQQGFCLLKVYNISDTFLMQQKMRKFKTRVNKLTSNPHVLNIYSVNKIQKKEICANNYQLQVYMQNYESNLSEMINRRLKEKINFQQKEIIQFLMKVVQSLIYIQDNGLKNIQIDAEAIVFSQNYVKILDCGIACSKSYEKLLSERQRGMSGNSNRIYLAPQLLKDLVQMNYDPYISPKADIFSMGMLLFEMVTLEPMNSYYDYVNATIDYDSLIHRLSRIIHSLNLKTLLAEMLEYDPDQRIGLVSLRQKLQKLANVSSQSMPRSRSSKMLKDLLSQSRRSNYSNKNGDSNQNSSMKRQQSTQRHRNKIDTHATGSSFKSSRQLMNQSQNNKKIVFVQKTFKQDLLKQPMLSKGSLETNIDSTQFKNIVKNKLNRVKNIEKQNSKEIITGISTTNKYKNSIFSKLQSHNETKNVLQVRNMNHLQSSSKKNPYQINQQEKKMKLNNLKNLVQENNIQRILKLQEFDNKKVNIQQNLRCTSRFGSNQITQNNSNMNLSSMKHNEIRKISNIYVDQENQMQIQQQLKLLQEEDLKLGQKNMNNDRPLNKVMTFNKEFHLNARSVQQSERFNSQKQEEYFQISKKLTIQPQNRRFMINKSQFIEFEASPDTKIIIKDVPVVISQQKDVYQQNKDIQKSKFGKLQRQLNMMNYVNSMDHDTSKQNSFLNISSKVICNYQPQPLQPDYSSIKTQEYNITDANENPGFNKKGKFKKPKLNIQINDQESYYSNKAYKVQKIQANQSDYNLVVDKSITEKQKTVKNVQVIESSPNFIDLSPITGFKDMSYSGYNATNNVKQFSIKRSYTNQSKQVLFNKKVMKNGAIYQGQLSRQGVPHGNGILLHQNNYKYSGSFRQGKFNGFGTIINLRPTYQIVDHKYIDFNSGSWIKYQGQFQNGLKNGFGTLFFNNNQKFSGCWKKDIIQGYGCFYKKEGEIVSGLWSQNSFKKI